MYRHLLHRFLRLVKSRYLLLILILASVGMGSVFILQSTSNPPVPYALSGSIGELLSDHNFNLTGYPISQPLFVCSSLPNRSFEIDIDTIPVDSTLSIDMFNVQVHYQLPPLSNSSIGHRILVFVISSVPNYEARQAIRQTWAKHARNHYQTKYLFVLGAPKTAQQSLDLIQEQNQNGDLLVYAFPESYYSLVLKSVSILKWTHRNCPDTLYAVKVDDDVLINWDLLYQTLSEWRPEAESRPIVIGQVRSQERPIHDPRNKWFIDRSEFAQPVFPSFAAGPMYVLSKPAVHHMLAHLNTSAAVHLEDVFITGILRQSVPGSLLVEPRPHLVDFKSQSCYYARWHAIHGISAAAMPSQWSLVTNSTSVHCSLFARLLCMIRQPF